MLWGKIYMTAINRYREFDLRKGKCLQDEIRKHKLTAFNQELAYPVKTLQKVTGRSTIFIENGCITINKLHSHYNMDNNNVTV